MNRAPVALLLIALSVAPPIRAQGNSPLAAPVPPILLLPGSTRAMGLGNAYVAGTGPEVIFYNPAQVGESRGTTLSWQGFAGNASLASLATNTTALGVSIGAGVQYLEYRALRADGGSPASQLTRAGAHVASSSLGLLSASVERNGIRIGVTGKYVAQHASGGRRSVPTFDYGAATDLGPITIAMALQDADDMIGDGRAAGLRLPTRLTIGGMATSLPIGIFWDLGASAAVAMDTDGEVSPAGGVELSYLPVSGWSFTGRVGAQRVVQPHQTGEASFTFGGTINADRIALDYAFQQYRGERATHRVGVRIR